jgi:hypothetical protein
VAGETVSCGSTSSFLQELKPAKIRIRNTNVILHDRAIFILLR